MLRNIFTGCCCGFTLISQESEILDSFPQGKLLGAAAPVQQSDKLKFETVRRGMGKKPCRDGRTPSAMERRGFGKFVEEECKHSMYCVVDHSFQASACSRASLEHPFRPRFSGVRPVRR